MLTEQMNIIKSFYFSLSLLFFTANYNSYFFSKRMVLKLKYKITLK